MLWSRTSSGTHKRHSIGLYVEQYGPIVCALAAGAALFYWADAISRMFSDGGWKSVGLYSAIFGWSAIQTGFAFGVYGFVMGKTEGFMAQIKDTRAMSRFTGYIKRANITGFLLTIVSIPLIIAEPLIDKPMSVSYILVSIWFSLFVWAFLAFLRLAYNFGQIASVKEKEFHGA